MRDVVICEPLNPVGRFGGMFKPLAAHELGAIVVRGLLDRTGLPPEAVEDVLFAQCYPSMDAPALGRVVALDAGLPTQVGGLQIDRRCGSGLQALVYGVMQVASGASDLVLTGGAESMSNAPLYSTEARWGSTRDGLMFHDSLARGRVRAGGRNFPVPGGMIETAENLRRDYDIGRENRTPSPPNRIAVRWRRRNAHLCREIVPSRSRAARATRCSTATSIPATTFRPSRWLG